ncbi:hypothetical protein LSTR_LSTR008589 [Laodelphax striatellus]|uniref:RNA helicase n=1 Tax=Laodelphax striatellus TaxID=195883 RepID=A0A482WWM0_LAOST|nr:hypothetical protein LSTR_LSTR008589 [Laodelphax striatellus]
MEVPTRESLELDPDWKRIEYKAVNESGSIWAATFPAPKMYWTEKELEKLVGVDKIEFKKGDMYAVKGKGGDYWYRGEVLCSIDDKVEVFLVDIGDTRWIEKTNVRLLSDYSKKILPQIFQVNFHGIQPLKATFDGGLKFTKVPALRWSRGAVELMEKKLHASKAIYFKEMETVNLGKFDNTKNVKFGILCIEYMSEIVCLNDILCAEGFATKVESFRGFAEKLTRNIVERGTKKTIKEKKINTEKTIDTEKKIETEKKPVDVEENIQYTPPSFESSASIVNRPPSFFEKIKGLANYMFMPSSSYIERFSETKFVNINSVSDEKNIASTADESADESSTNMVDRTSSANRLTSDSGSELTGCSDIEMQTRKRERREIKKYGNNMLSLFNILIHSSPDIVEPIEPVTSLIESYVCDRVQKVLKDRRRSDLTPLQKYVYPVLCKRHNMVVIGNTTSGKTLASVVAIVSLLRQEEFYSSLKKDYGPKAIHLCSYSYKVRNVTTMYKELISGSDIVVKMACGGTGVDKVKIDLLGGCDVLVTTPACMVRILNAAQITNLNRLCHIVYDDADMILDVFLDEIKKLTASIKALEETRTTYKVQKLVLTQIWFPKLKDFIKNVIKSGFICVSNFNQLEAALYSSLKPHFELMMPQTKAEYLISLLQKHPSPARVVVVCNDQDEVLLLEEKLKSTGKRIMVAHEGMNPIQVSYVKNAWKETMTRLHPVMICTDSKDSIMSELEITDCTWLIHYNLPSSKTVFSNRFGCLVDSYTNIFLEDQGKEKPRINIFVDETNEDQFPMIVQLMKRLMMYVDPSIEKVVKQIKKQKEKAKKHSPVCDKLREFGVCYEQKVCNFRHIFMKSVDGYEKTDLPKTGFVKLRILNVHSANHYSAQILEFKAGSVWTKMPNVELLELISMKMDNYFSQQSNLFTYPNPVLGDMVAVQPENDVFYRGKVISILKRDEKKAPRVVLVKLVDSGSIMEFNVMKLYDLPDELKAYEGQAIDVFLCNLKPADHDCSWDVDTVKHVQRWMDSAKNAIRVNGKNHYLFGQINMSAGHTLWMDHITHCEWLEYTKTEVHSSLGFELLQKKLALPNPEHMKMIRKLCLESKLNVSINEPKQEKCSINGNAQQWAHLPRDEFSPVEVILAKNPDLMFIRHTKFKDRLDRLTKDLSEAKLSILHEGGVVVGDICLAFFEDDGSWNRAKVMELKSATEVKVFFVDHGDFKNVGWNDLAKIPDTFITRLPFQAMECRLAGVTAPNGQWSEGIDGAIYQLTEFEEEICKTLQAYVVDLELQATVTGGRKYSIVLLDTNSNPFAVINEELCISGQAELHLDDDRLFEDIVSIYKVESDTDEESEEDFLDEPESQHEFIDLNGNTEKVELENSKNVEEYSDSQNRETWSDVRWDGERVIPVAEPESIPGPFQTILENFEEYEDDLFNLLGLNKNQVLKTILPSLENETVDTPKIREIQNTSDVDGDISDGEDKCSSKTKIRTKHKNKRRESEGERKLDCNNDVDDDDRPPPLVNAGDCYNPKVTWFDDREHVWVYIHLTNVQDYKVTWSYRSLSCRTINEGKYYSADFTLFGVIDPTFLEHSAKGFYVSIKMKKYVYGELWPRLMITNQHYYWIKRHVDHIAEESDSCDDIASSKQEKMALKHVAFNKEDFIMDPKPSGFYTDSDFSSDPYEPPDSGFQGSRDDPEDPLGMLHR